MRHNGIRAIALLEGFKGFLAICAASGLLLLIHEDLHALAVSLVEHAHLNPASRYPRIFIDAATHLKDSHLVLMALGAAAYSLLRFVEAYGLYFERAWAELLAAASGAIYVPFEVAELAHRPGWLSIGLLGLNIVIVAVMIRALWQRRSGATGSTP
jgi:uncharacterized membrane protein (DUF2068 family)